MANPFEYRDRNIGRLPRLQPSPSARAPGFRDQPYRPPARLPTAPSTYGQPPPLPPSVDFASDFGAMSEAGSEPASDAQFADDFVPFLAVPPARNEQDELCDALLFGSGAPAAAPAAVAPSNPFSARPRGVQLAPPQKAGAHSRSSNPFAKAAASNPFAKSMGAAAARPYAASQPPPLSLHAALAPCRRSSAPLTHADPPA